MGEKSQEKKRLFGIDVPPVKVLSIFFVVVIHFFLRTKYYTTTLSGGNMYLQSYIRWIVLCGVPLFIMCTGYLSRKEEASPKYYKKIFRVIITYIIISIICIAAKQIIGIEKYTLKTAVYALFDFTGDDYSWYVNMYIGLFLLAPIFNYCINNTTKKQLRCVIVALVIVVALPSTFNQILMYDGRFTYFRFPEWWQNFYPVMFYFLGAYIAKYKPVPKKAPCCAIILSLPVLQTALQVYFSKNPVFDNWVFYDNGSLYFVVESVCIFLLLYSAENKNKAFGKTMSVLSNATLEIYLFSYLTDVGVYKIFRIICGFPNTVTQREFFVRYFIVTVLLSFTLSSTASIVFKFVYGLIEGLLKKIFAKKKISD